MEHNDEDDLPNNRFQQTTSKYYLNTIVTAIERSKKDPIIRFDAQTNLPGYRTTQFRDIRRTHHEFEKLADHLVIQNPECMVPALYPSLTSYGAGTDEDERQLKTNMQHWLNLICSNVILIRDTELVHFIESDFGWSPVISKGRPASGIKRRAIKQLQPPPDDTPELAEARPIVKQFYILTTDTHTKLSRLVKSRATLAVAEQEFGRRLGDLSLLENHSGMANAFSRLGRTLQAVSDTHSAHSTLESATLGDSFAYHADDAFIAKETLTTRQILVRELNQAQNSSRTKQANASRMKSSSNLQTGKVDEALASLEEAKALEQQLTNKLQRVTASLLQETRTWNNRTSQELRISLKEYARKQVESERRVLAILESVRPDIRAVDASGGLSRLGRTNLQRSGSYVGPSQTVEGDAWSGVKRSTPASTSILSSNEAQRLAADSPRNGFAANGDDAANRVNAKNAASILASGF